MLWLLAPQRSWRIIWIPVSTGMTKRIMGGRILVLKISMICARNAEKSLGW